jgi:oxygen-independent coproporphyrinogen-3 oxidase
MGPSAHSYNGVSRQWNCSSVKEYLSSVALDKLPFEMEVLTGTDKYNEFIMTGIRTSHGIDIKELEKLFGIERAQIFLSSAGKFIRVGWMENAGNSFILTKKGKLFADRVASGLFLLNDTD